MIAGAVYFIDDKPWRTNRAIL